MENMSLTSRIVGAIVILSLGIIFIPLLLETDNVDSGSMKNSPIPEIPNEISTIIFQLNEETGKFEEEGNSPVDKFEASVRHKIANSANEVEMPEVSPIAVTVDSATATAAQPISRPITKPPVKQDAPQDKTRHSWMLQLASFKDEKKALKLRDALRKKKYVTHIAERKLDSGSLWRVRIGPEVSKAKIVKAQKILEKEMGLKGLIVRRR